MTIEEKIKNQLISSRYKGPKVSFRFESRTYVLLTFVKMRRLPVTPEQCSTILKGLFGKPSDAKRSIDVLVKDGCLVPTVPGKWRITPKGIEVVYMVGTAKKNTSLIRGRY